MSKNRIEIDREWYVKESTLSIDKEIMMDVSEIDPDSISKNIEYDGFTFWALLEDDGETIEGVVGLEYKDKSGERKLWDNDDYLVSLIVPSHENHKKNLDDAKGEISEFSDLDFTSLIIILRLGVRYKFLKI